MRIYSYPVLKSGTVYHEREKYFNNNSNLYKKEVIKYNEWHLHPVKHFLTGPEYRSDQ